MEGLCRRVAAAQFSVCRENHVPFPSADAVRGRGVRAAVELMGRRTCGSAPSRRSANEERFAVLSFCRTRAMKLDPSNECQARKVGPEDNRV
jgi:hypothetical protein